MTDFSNQFEFFSSSRISLDNLTGNPSYLFLEDLDETALDFSDKPSRLANSKNSFELLSELKPGHMLLNSKQKLKRRNIVLSFFDHDDNSQKIYVFELKDINYLSAYRNQLGLVVDQSVSQDLANHSEHHKHSREKLFGKDVSLFLGPSFSSIDSEQRSSDMMMMSGNLKNYDQDKDGTGRISLKNVSKQSLVITNEPHTSAGHRSTSDIVSSWSHLFVDSDPNIILNLVNKETGEHRSEVLVMSKPEYNSDTNTLDFDISFSQDQEEANNENDPTYDLITGLDWLNKDKYNANLFIDNFICDWVPALCPDFVGNSAFQIVNNTDDTLMIEWTNYGADEGYKKGSDVFYVDPQKTSHYIYGETDRDWDVSMKVSDLFGNTPRYIGQFDAQRPNIGHAWMSINKEMTKIYSPGQNFKYEDTITSGDQKYPFTALYTSGYVKTDPINHGNIDSNLNIWQITFHDFT